MILENVLIAGEKNLCSISISENKIANISSKNTYNAKQSIVFDNVIAFPGLINAHDHLSFNLYPQLKNRVYQNYLEWSSDIHSKNEKIIKEVNSIDNEIKVKWGIIKNIFHGFTTIIDHNHEKNVLSNGPDVWYEYNYLHSVKLHKKWKKKFFFLFNNKPWMVHLNEGIGENVEMEWEVLKRWNLFKKPIVAVHGISLSLEAINNQNLKGLIWCPDSNNYLYNQKASIAEFLNKIPIFFGTDATISSSPLIFDHIRFAKNNFNLNGVDIFNMLTINPAGFFRGMENKGEIKSNNRADIVIAKKKKSDYINSFFDITPADILLILKDGKPILIEPELAKKSFASRLNDFSLVKCFDTIRFIPKYIIGEIPLKTQFKFEPPFSIEVINE